MARSSTAGGGQFLREDEQAAGGGVLAVHASVVRELDHRLRVEHQLSVSEFDVLITLFNAPGRRRRMSDLAGAVMLSAAGVTHLVNRLALVGLVERNVAPSDRRSFLVSLTDKGLERLDAARATHNRVIRERFLGRLSADQRRRLADIWAAVDAEGVSDSRPGSRRGRARGSPR
jgi:DNA-binding MarR family transcriptional regulator